MKKLFTGLFVFLMFAQVSFAATFYSQSSSAPNTAANWNTARDGSGTNAVAGDFTAGNIFIVQGSGNGGTTPHTMTTSATWSVLGVGSRIEIENGATLQANNAITVASGTTFAINNGGTYIHNNTGAPATTIFTGIESFGASSNFELRNWVNSSTAIPTGITWGNFLLTFSPTAAWNQSGAISTVNGNFTINNASAFAFRFCGNASHTLTIAGSLNITSGIIQFSNAGAATNSFTLNMGSYNQTGGTFAANVNASSTLSMRFTGANGTFTQSAGTLTNTQLNWFVNSGAVATLSNNLLVATARTINVIGTLNLATFSLTGTGTATLTGSGTLGASTDFATQISGFGTNSFTGGYSFTGTSQTIPANTYTALTINGTSTTLGGNVTVTGALTLTAGTVTLGANNLTAGSISGGSASSYVVTDGAGVLTVNNISSAVLFPVGRTSYNPVTVDNTGGVADNFSVSVQNTIDNPTFNDAHTVGRQWNISEAVAGGSTVTLTMQWTTGEEGGLFNRAGNLYIGHWDAVNSIYDPYSATLGGSAGTWTATATGKSEFSPFIVGDDGALPVELASFTSSTIGNNVKLNWSTVNEENNSGFDIERKSVAGEWTKIGNVAGNGTSTTGHNYSFEDRNIATGNYNYRLKQIDYNGNFEYFSLSNEVIVGVPSKFELSQNYPNPFNPSTTINYQLANNSFVSLKIYDMSGKEVAALVNTMQTAGYYSVNFNALSLSSGMYFYTIKANDFVSTKRMMLVK